MKTSYLSYIKTLKRIVCLQVSYHTGSVCCLNILIILDFPFPSQKDNLHNDVTKKRLEQIELP